MKKLTPQLLTVLITATVLLKFSSCACKKQVLGPDGLPPITDTGANTFGCMINGQPFVPGGKGFNGQSPIQCAYQYFDNGYHLALSGTKKTTYTIESISISTDSMPVLAKGQTYILEKRQIGNATAGYFLAKINSNGSGTINTYNTTNDSNLTGELTITNLNNTQQILSGTFWFNAINDQNPYDTVKVTQGRFDVHFTR